MPIAVSFKERLSGAVAPPQGTLSQDLRLVVESLVADVVNLRATVAALTTSYNGTLTKLDADATVTDVNYNALGAGTAPIVLFVSN